MVVTTNRGRMSGSGTKRLGAKRVPLLKAERTSFAVPLRSANDPKRTSFPSLIIRKAG